MKWEYKSKYTKVPFSLVGVLFLTVLFLFGCSLGGTSVSSPEIDLLEPLLETGFETTLLEEGWKRENLKGTGDKWARRTSIKRTGSASAGMENQFSGSQEDDWLITPGITVTENSELRFYRCSAWADLYHYNGVWVSTVDQDPDNFHELVELGEAPDGGWYFFSIDLSAYAGQTIYVAFVYKYTASVGDGFYIDDVEITQ